MSEGSSRIRRPVASDLASVVDLLNRCDLAETGSSDTTAQDIENDWMLEGFDLQSDAWVAVSTGGQIVGYVYAGDQLRNGQLEADVWVHPDRHEPRLTDRLLTLAERRARELARMRRYREAGLDVFCITTNPAKREVLRTRGFRLQRTIYRMAAHLASPPSSISPPVGIEVRAFRFPADARIMYATMRDACADSFWQSDEPYEAWRARLAGHASFDPGLWFIAWEGDQAVGGVVAYDHGDLGWIKGLGVRRAWRRRGIGGALLAAVFAELLARGQRRVELGVDTEATTHPLRLYESVGMRMIYAYEAYRLPLVILAPPDPR